MHSQNKNIRHKKKALLGDHQPSFWDEIQYPHKKLFNERFIEMAHQWPSEGTSWKVSPREARSFLMLSVSKWRAPCKLACSCSATARSLSRSLICFLSLLFWALVTLVVTSSVASRSLATSSTFGVSSRACINQSNKVVLRSDILSDIWRKHLKLLQFILVPLLQLMLKLGNLFSNFLLLFLVTLGGCFLQAHNLGCWQRQHLSSGQSFFLFNWQNGRRPWSSFFSFRWRPRRASLSENLSPTASGPESTWPGSSSALSAISTLAIMGEITGGGHANRLKNNQLLRRRHGILIAGRRAATIAFRTVTNAFWKKNVK